MKPSLRWKVACAFGLLFGVQFIFACTSQRPPLDTHPAQVETTAQALHRTSLTLVMLKDFREYRRIEELREQGEIISDGNPDCPKCELYCAKFTPPSGDAITDVRVVATRSHQHWYRCRVEVNCGLPEFSNITDLRMGCAGEADCRICRASDNVIQAEDDIIVDSHPAPNSSQSQK